MAVAVAGARVRRKWVRRGRGSAVLSWSCTGCVLVVPRSCPGRALVAVGGGGAGFLQ